MPQAIPYVIFQLGINVAIANFILTAAFAYAVSSVVSSIFKPKIPAASPVVRDNTLTVREPLSTRKIVYGQARVGGTIVYIDVTGDNQYLHLVIAFASHEIQSFDTFYFDDEALTLSGNDVTAPSHLDGKVKIYTHLGTDSQAADADLVTASAQWTSNHRLRGIAYAYVRLEYDSEAFASGIPNITALLSGKKCYDPRTGTTVWTDNAALCSADYLMDTRYGLKVPSGNVDMTVLTTAADTCEESVALLAGGTEERYTCNGMIDLGDTPRTIIESLATAKAAPTVAMMGQWYVHAGEYRTPALSFDEDDLAGPLSVQTKHARSELFNHVKGTYSSPDNNWQPSDFPVVTSSTYLTEDNGEVIWRDLVLPFTISAATAQRIGLLQLNQHRRQITVQATFKLTALDAIPTDVIQLSNTRLGWSSKTFEVVDWQFAVADDSALGIAMTLRETDSAIYTWSTADESAANAAPTTNMPDFRTVQAPTGLSVSSVQVPTGSGSDETFQALLTWTAPSDYFVVNGGLIEVEYRETGAASWFPSWFVSGNQTAYLITMLEAGLSYDFRIRSFNGIAYSSYNTVSGITILTSGGVATSEDWGEWVSTPTSRTAGCGADFGEWVSSPSCSEDWGSFT